MAGGWVKLHRKIESWEWYQDGNTFRLFLHLVMKANHEPKKWLGVTIDRGQCASSINNLAEALGLSIKQIRTAIKHLEKSQNVASKGASDFTIFTIPNYEIYQAKDEDEDEEDEQEGASERANEGQTKGKRRANEGQQTRTIRTKRTKELKEDKREYGPFVHLTEAEYQKIVETVGEEGAAWCIQKLSGHKEAKGTKYKSDMGAMRKWVFDAWEERKRGPTSRGTGKESNIQRNDRVIDEYIWDQEQGGRNGQEADCTIIEAHKPELPGK
jgi:hypothetical protein